MSIDEKISSLFKVVQKKKEEVALVEKEQNQSWLTNCSFKGFAQNHTNIQTASENTIFRLTTELLMFRNTAVEANELLGTKQEIKIDNYSVDEWLQDFKKRIAKIQLASKKAELKNLEDRLNAIVSPEQRRVMELEEITKSLGV